MLLLLLLFLVAATVAEHRLLEARRNDVEVSIGDLVLAFELGEEAAVGGAENIGAIVPGTYWYVSTRECRDAQEEIDTLYGTYNQDYAAGRVDVSFFEGQIDTCEEVAHLHGGNDAYCKTHGASMTCCAYCDELGYGNEDYLCEQVARLDALECPGHQDDIDNFCTGSNSNAWMCDPNKQDPQHAGPYINKCPKSCWLHGHKSGQCYEKTPGTYASTCVRRAPAAVNGGWGQWTAWSGCSVTCGSGKQHRSRECNNPAPAHGGADCSGSATEEKVCNPGPCCPASVQALFDQGYSCEVLEMNNISTEGCDQCGGCPCTKFLDEGYKCSAIESAGLDCSKCPRCNGCEVDDMLATGEYICRQLAEAGYSTSGCDCSETCMAQTKQYLTDAYDYTCAQLADWGFDTEGCPC